MEPDVRERLFSKIAEFTLVQLQERFAHPYQYAEEIHRLLSFMMVRKEHPAGSFGEPKEAGILMESALGIEKCILFSQLTQNFGIRRKDAERLVTLIVPEILGKMGKKLTEKNGMFNLLKALKVENPWLFLNAQVLLPIQSGRKVGVNSGTWFKSKN